MERPKLTYFDFPGGRGEDCRLAFFIAGVDFEDHRIDSSEWADLKPRTPFGGLPILELPGEGILGQSNAILRLIGTRHGLHPDNDFEAARHESLMAAVEDLRAQLAPTLRMRDEEEKRAARAELSQGYLPRWGSAMDRAIGGGPFLAGERIHVADIKIFGVVRWVTGGGVDYVSDEVFSACHRLTRLANAVREHPRVVEWNASS